jgi:Zn-dependent peptidase ImmA (M78 family)
MRDFIVDKGPVVTIDGQTVHIFYANIPRSVNGFTADFKDGALCIVLNRSQSKEDHIKTLAHEITHILRGDIVRGSLPYMSRERAEMEKATCEQAIETLERISEYIDPDTII